MQVRFDPYRYNCYQKKYAVKRPTFKSANTMAQKIDVLLAETKKLFRYNKNANIPDFEKIIKQISPETTVKHYMDVPYGSNTSPKTCAYFSQKIHINNMADDMVADNKIIYLNPDYLGENSQLKLFADFVHEGTHIAQEEAADRISSVDFSKQILRSDMYTNAKLESLEGGIKGFTSIEYNILLPLIEIMKKETEIPQALTFANKEFLNTLFKQTTGCSTTNFIRIVTEDIMSQIKKIFPNGDTNFMLKYVHKKAGLEKEAHEVSLKFMKEVLGINTPTDLDFRILLYDEFEQVVKSMIR